MFCNTFHTKCFSLPSLPSTIIILFHRIDSENSKQKNHGALALWLSISHTFPSIKATVDKSIAYICNPDKIDGELYVSSLGNAYTRENIKERIETQDEYYGAAEPPVRCGESHLSGLTEPLRSL